MWSVDLTEAADFGLSRLTGSHFLREGGKRDLMQALEKRAKEKGYEVSQPYSIEMNGRDMVAYGRLYLSRPAQPARLSPKLRRALGWE